MRAIPVIVVLVLLQQPAPPRGVKLERVAATAAAQALEANSVVLVPLGSGLQAHGEHLSLGSDLVLAEHLAHRVMEATPVVVAPALPYHFSADAARDATVEIVRGLAASGPRRFYVLNTSAPASAALSAAATVLARDGVLLRFTDPAPIIGTHAKERETSMLLHIDAPSVKMERADSDVAAAAADRGKIFVGTAVESLVRDIDALRRATPPAPQAPEPVRPAVTAPPPSSEPRRPSGCTAGDERAISELATRLSAYWVTANVDSMADLWSEEGDLVHPDGAVERGRPIIRENRRDQFRRKEYRSSKYFVRFGPIRCVSAEIAVADGKWELSGVYDAAGAPMPRGDGPLTVVVKKHGGTWLFEAYRYSVTIASQGAKPPTLLKKPGYPDK